MKFDDKVEAKIRAWHDLHRLFQQTVAQVDSMYADYQEGALDGAIVGFVGAARKVMSQLEVVRRDVLSTPTPGQNAGSKLARGLQTDVTFTPDDLAQALPDVDHSIDLQRALEILQEVTPELPVGRKTAAFTEQGSAIKYLLSYRTTPRGGVEITEELRNLRKGEISHEDLASMLDGIEV